MGTLLLGKIRDTLKGIGGSGSGLTNGHVIQSHPDFLNLSSQATILGQLFSQSAVWLLTRDNSP